MIHTIRAAHSVLCCLLVAYSLSTAVAQTKSKRDSLVAITTNPSTADSSKIFAQISLGEYYRFINADSAGLYLDEAMNFAHKIGFKKGEGFGFNIKGLISKDQNKTEEAIEYFNTAISLLSSAEDSLRAANIYNNIGLTWYDISNKPNADRNFSIALRIYQRHNDLKGIGISYINFGQINRKQGLYFTSLDYYFKALSIFEKNAISEEQLANTYGNIGTVYNHLEKYNEAILYQKKALAIFEKLNQLLKVSIVKTNMANMYLEINQLNDAEKNAMDAIDYFRTNKRPRIIVANQIILISVAIKKNEFDKASAMADEATDLLKIVNDPEMEATILTNRAEIHFLKKEYLKAQRLAEKAVEISQTHNLLQAEKEATKQLADILIAMGNFKDGYRSFNRFTALKDSIFNKAKLSQLFELEKKYEIDKKQSEVDLLESKNRIAALELVNERRSRLQLIIGLSFLFIISAVIYGGYRTKSKLNIQLGQQNQEIKTQNELIGSINIELQARALRAQMNPHFIFNSLSSIQYLIIKNNTEKAFEYLSQFASLLRQVMNNSEKDWITLSEEIEILKLYLELEKLRFNNSFDYSIETIPGLENTKIPPLLIQPYVENAIGHGLLPKENDRRLRITFSGNDKQVLCEVEDNGIGRMAAAKIANEKNRVFTSRGMNYTEERLLILNAITGGKSKIEIFDLMQDQRASGTLVRITINQH